jgi:hypothetical protein
VGRNPLTGQQRQVSRAVRGSRQEAEKALAAFYAEVDAHAAPASKGTVGELLEAWLDQVADELSPKTVHEYRRLIQVRIRPGLGDRPVKRLDASEVDQFYRALQRQAGLALSRSDRWSDVLARDEWCRHLADWTRTMLGRLGVRTSCPTRRRPPSVTHMGYLPFT